MASVTYNNTHSKTSNVSTFEKYDIVFGNFASYGNRSVQQGNRPGVVIQSNIGNRYSPTLVVLPLTTKLKKANMPTHMVIKSDYENGLEYDSMLLAEQVTTVCKEDVRKIGHISDTDTQKEIFECFMHITLCGIQDQDLFPVACAGA